MREGDEAEDEDVPASFDEAPLLLEEPEMPALLFEFSVLEPLTALPEGVVPAVPLVVAFGTAYTFEVVFDVVLLLFTLVLPDAAPPLE